MWRINVMLAKTVENVESLRYKDDNGGNRRGGFAL